MPSPVLTRGAPAGPAVSGRAPVPTRRRLPGLDGLRAMAIIAVLVFHADPDWLPGGFLGVDVFFVISGFLITTLLLSERDRTGRIDLGAFYRRRVRRLLPALAVMLVVVSITVVLFRRDQLGPFRHDLLAALVYGSNWWYIVDQQPYFQAVGPPSMLAHLWSLAVEEQFYLLWPIAVIVLLGRSRRVERVAGWALAGAAVSTAWMGLIAFVTDVPYGADSSRVYYGTDTHAMSLLAGAAAAAALRWCNDRPPFARRVRSWALARPSAQAPWWLRHAWWAELLGVAALAGLTWIAVTVDEYRPGLYRGGFLGVAGLSVIAVLVLSWPGSLLGAALEWRPMRWLGRRSYEVYLWHWPVFLVVSDDVVGWATFALRLLVTLGLSEATHRLVAGGRWPLAFGAIRRPVVGLGLAGVLLVTGLAVSVTPAANPPVPALAAAAGVVAAGPRPTLPAAPAPVPTVGRELPAVYRGAVAAFGDSVILGASYAMREVITGLSVNATIGVQAGVVLTRVRHAELTRRLPPVVVIHTGNNGIVNPADLNHTLDLLRDRAKVVIVNDRLPRSWQTPNNRTFARAVATHRNAVLFDWNSLAAGHRAWFTGDDVHLQPAGAAVYAETIVRLLD